MADGISPREASDRLNFYMVRFDDLWRKYVTYSGGEQLFGLEVTDYPELHRVRRELNLLQKLYGLYNDVLEKVGGYYDTPWHDIDIDVINTELIDFQNKSVKWRCRRRAALLRYPTLSLNILSRVSLSTRCGVHLRPNDGKDQSLYFINFITNKTTHRIKENVTQKLPLINQQNTKQAQQLSTSTAIRL